MLVFLLAPFNALAASALWPRGAGLKRSEYLVATVLAESNKVWAITAQYYLNNVPQNDNGKYTEAYK